MSVEELVSEKIIIGSVQNLIKHVIQVFISKVNYFIMPILYYFRYFEISISFLTEF